jgi:MFS family permease
MFGPRKIGIMGGLVSTISLFASVFVNEMKLYFLTYGLGFGVGQALLLTATLAILPHYFNKKLSLANGLMNLIAAVIFVVLPYGTSYVIKHYSLKGLFYFLAALNLGSVLMAFTFLPLLPVSKDVKMLTRIKDSFGVEVLKKIKFLCWCIGTLIAMFGYLIPVYNIVWFKYKNCVF